MKSRFALIALAIAMGVLSLALFITVMGVTASSVSGEAIGSEAVDDIREGTDNRLLASQRPNISQDEPLSLTGPISIYLPLLSTVGYIDKEAERDALMALYNSTNGDAWFINTGWGTNSSLCDWYGVTCDEYRHVKILNLDRNGMTGTFPSEIINLPMLTVLRLTGTIICYGTKTSHYCEYYQLSGPLPPEIGNLQNLQELILDDNKLLFLPPEIGNLTSLQVLSLPNNQLSGPIPAFFSNLHNLWRFDLSENPSLTCWETQTARDWALSLDSYYGPTCYFP